MTTGSDKTPGSAVRLSPEKLKATISGDRVQLEFLIEDLAKQLIIDRGVLVANGCNGCNSCS